MPNTGAAVFDDASDDATVGTVAWSNALNARAAADDNYAMAELDASTSHYLKLLFSGLNYSPSPPASSVIVGIEVAIDRSVTGGGFVRDASIRMVKAGSVVGTNKASATQWPAVDAVATYGGAADLWGTTWTVDEVKAEDFGIVISAEEILNIPTTAQVDSATVTIHYTGGGNAPIQKTTFVLQAVHRAASF